MGETIVRVTRVLDATPAAVFAAWTAPEAMKTWMAPSDAAVAEAAADPRPGGRWRIVMRGDEGQEFAVGGEYVEVVPGETLVFTWQWEHEDRASLVTVRLRQQAGGTELILEHSRLADEANRTGHAQGWDDCLAQLATMLRMG